MSFDKTIALCSAYIPPNSSIILAQLKHLTDQQPFILYATLMNTFPLYRVVKQPMTKAKNLKTSPPRRNYVRDGSDTFSQLLILHVQLLIHLFFHDTLCGNYYFSTILESFSSTVG